MITAIAVFFSIAVALFALAQDDPYDIPLPPLFSNKWPSFNPGGTLQFTFYDRPDRLSTVTGRSVTYEVEMGHLNPAGGGLPNAESSGAMMLNQIIQQDISGRISFLPHATIGDEWIFGGPGVASNSIRARVSEISNPNLEVLTIYMHQARQSEQTFPGYEIGVNAPSPDNTFFLNDTYCGFDMYEWTSIPFWATANLAAPTPPFDTARLFGWPSSAVGNYRYAATCNHIQCSIEIDPTGWLSLRYSFGKPEI